jgi:hypothetical protein
MLLKINDVDYIQDYKLSLTFNDGVKKTVDLKPYLTGKVFEPLLSLDNFKQYSLNRWTIEWFSGADFAPEFLYSL